MANLIIKPTSGGSLILQDEGGDAALTVGTTGSTTLAGTAIFFNKLEIGSFIRFILFKILFGICAFFQELLQGLFAFDAF